MLQQVQAIPFFKLAKGAPFGIRNAGIFPEWSGLGFALAPTYMEFYCQSGGSNLNSGTDQSNTAKYTSTNGNWNQSTNVFTPTDGSNPAAAGIKPGDWMSIYIDGATVAVCSLRIGTVENAANGRIFYAGTGNIGTSPTTSATARTCKVGGAWRGPNGTTMWPFNASSFSNATDGYGNSIRINMKNDVTYMGTGGAGSAVGIGGPIGSILQGYANNPGDGGRATFNANGYNPGGGAACNNADQCIIADMIITGISFGDGANHQCRSSSGTAGSLYWRVTAFNSPGAGFVQANTNAMFIECEAYACCQNGFHQGGFIVTAQAVLINCYSHDHVHKFGITHGFNFGSGSNVNGPMFFLNCIAANNTGHGFVGGDVLSNAFFLFNCEAYNNTGSGFRMDQNVSSAGGYIYNSNFIKNGQYGIDLSANTTTRTSGLIMNCGFGNGTQANAKGKINYGRCFTYIQELGRIDYPNDTTPYASPTTGNFSLINPYALGAGRSYWPQSDGVHSGTAAYPDVGAAQSAMQSISVAGLIETTWPKGYVGFIYGITQLFTGGISDIRVISGSLPAGLSLSFTSTTITLSGTPTTAGTSDFTLQITAGAAISSYINHITIDADPSDGVGGMILG